MKIWIAALISASFTVSALAETPQEFAVRMQSFRGVTMTVNQREDGSFGSVSIRIPPKVLSDRATAGELLTQIGRFAAEGKFKADLLTPSQEDRDYAAQKLKEAGAGNVSARVMAETVSKKDTRIFLIPDKTEK